MKPGISITTFVAVAVGGVVISCLLVLFGTVTGILCGSRFSQKVKKMLDPDEALGTGPEAIYEEVQLEPEANGIGLSHNIAYDSVHKPKGNY